MALMASAIYSEPWSTSATRSRPNPASTIPPERCRPNSLGQPGLWHRGQPEVAASVSPQVLAARSAASPPLSNATPDPRRGQPRPPSAALRYFCYCAVMKK
jgi:hypothetical protein